jgi:hypothetical protein
MTNHGSLHYRFQHYLVNERVFRRLSWWVTVSRWWSVFSQDGSLWVILCNLLVCGEPIHNAYPCVTKRADILKDICKRTSATSCNKVQWQRRYTACEEPIHNRLQLLQQVIAHNWQTLQESLQHPMDLDFWLGSQSSQLWLDWFDYDFDVYDLTAEVKSVTVILRHIKVFVVSVLSSLHRWSYSDYYG